VLPHREDLIEQLKRHVQGFNTSRNDLYIRLRELKEYACLRRLPRRDRQAGAAS